MISQPLVVRGFLVPVLLAGSTYALEVFDRHPVVETVLRHHVVAEMPLAHVGVVVVVRDHVADGRDVAIERYVVALQTRVERVEAGHDRCAGGGADWLGDVGVFEHKALFGEPIEVRGLYPVVAIGAHRVAPLLVGQDEQDVRFLIWHVLRLDSTRLLFFDREKERRVRLWHAGSLKQCSRCSPFPVPPSP